MTTQGATARDREAVARPDVRRSALAGALLGIGLMGAIDEIVFHQLLGWHHFYDRSTPEWGLVSDGVLHAVTLASVVVALFLYADVRRRRAWSGAHWAGAFLLGLGGFQAFDGLVDHKLLDVHEIRYGVDLLPYDLAWNIPGALIALAGAWLLLRARGRPAGG